MNVPVIASSILQRYPSQVAGLDLDSFFDSLNLQSDKAANFTLASGAVSQWNDLSPAGRNATQGTAANRPAYNSGNISFDGVNDVLNFTEFAAHTFSFYLVYKLNSLATDQYLIGSPVAGAVYLRHYANTNSGLFWHALELTNIFGGVGGQIRYTLWGEDKYQVLSIRRNQGTNIAKVNGRTLARSGFTGGATVVQRFAHLGKGASAFGNAIIKAACISSEYFDDETDAEITDALFSRYALPEVSDSIVGFGDSITFGQGATPNTSSGWLNLLGTLKGKTIKNLGLSSSWLTNGGAVATGIGRWNTEIAEKPYSDTICILYGTNDSNFSVSASLFESNLRTIVNGFIDLGYAANKIFIGTVPYKVGDATAAVTQGYNVRITNICSDLGLSPPADVYNQMKAVGDSCMVDNLHPNNTGHLIIRDAFAAIMP
jgi:lysophospholipase L1-like esterase